MRIPTFKTHSMKRVIHLFVEDTKVPVCNTLTKHLPPMGVVMDEFINTPSEYQCKSCLRSTKRIMSEKNIRENKYHHENRDQILKIKRDRWVRLTQKSPLSVILYSLKNKSRLRDIPITITLKDIENKLDSQHGLCYYTGVKMIIGWKTGSPYQLSVDRVDSKFGYTTENVVLCCQAINFAKHVYSINVFKAFLNDINYSFRNQSHPALAKEINVICPDCFGDGVETCHNPDHGFLSSLGSMMGANESACPGCGHSEDHKMKGKCDTCIGTGTVSIIDYRDYVNTCVPPGDHENIFDISFKNLLSHEGKEEPKPLTMSEEIKAEAELTDETIDEITGSPNKDTRFGFRKSIEYLSNIFPTSEGKEEPKSFSNWIDGNTSKPKVMDEIILKTACKEYPKWFTIPEDAIKAKAFKKGMEAMRDLLTK